MKLFTFTDPMVVDLPMAWTVRAEEITLEVSLNVLVLSRIGALSNTTFKLALLGAKTFISFYKNYLVLVSPPNIPLAASRTFGVQVASVSANDTTRLTIVDTANKFTAYQAIFSQGIRSVICEWGSIYIVENGGRVNKTLRTVNCSIFFKDM